jgi:hypothetical protein
MTEDEIIEMAEQADLHATLYFRKEQLRKFAKLVAEKEREECAKECEDISITGILLDAISCNHTKNFCAHSIRARGQA